MLRKLVLFLGLCTHFTSMAAASNDQLPSSITDDKVSDSKKTKLYIIIGASCGGLIVLALIVVLIIWIIYRYTQLRKRNKVRNEIIAYFRDIKNAEVCRHCWGRQANVYCDDCPDHYFCISCSDHVHNIYKDKRCCRVCRKSLEDHKINNVSWPTEPQSYAQQHPLNTSDGQLRPEAVRAAQDSRKHRNTETEVQEISPIKENISINSDDKEPLLNKKNGHKFPVAPQFSGSMSNSPLNTSYTSLNSLLGYENEDN